MEAEASRANARPLNSSSPVVRVALTEKPEEYDKCTDHREKVSCPMIKIRMHQEPRLREPLLFGVEEMLAVSSGMTDPCDVRRPLQVNQKTALLPQRFVVKRFVVTDLSSGKMRDRQEIAK